MANIMPADAGSNEGTVAWTQVSGTSATITNSTDHAQDGSKSLKVVSAATGSIKIETAFITTSAGVSLSSHRYVGFASTGGIFVSAYYDFYQSGGTYISSSINDNNANANTSAWDHLTDTTVSPALTGKFKWGFQIDFTASSQTVYFDAITIDDGTASGTEKHLLAFFPGF